MHFGFTQRKQKGFAPILIILIIAGIALAVGGAYYFSKSQISKPQTQIEVSPTPKLTVTPTLNEAYSKELQRYPIYPNAKFISKETTAPFSDYRCEKGNDSPACIYGKNNFTFESSDKEDQVLDWYKDDKSGLGWKFYGGGQNISTYRKGNDSFELIWNSTPSSGTQFTISVVNKPVESLDQNQLDTSNWKTYTNGKNNFSIDIPQNLIFSEKSLQPEPKSSEIAWWYNWRSHSEEELQKLGVSADDIQKSSAIRAEVGYYDILLIITENALLHPAYDKPKPLTLENLKRMFIEDSELKEIEFQGRHGVRNKTILGQGEILDYYIINGKELVRLSATTYNPQKIPTSYIDQILSTFKFTN